MKTPKGLGEQEFQGLLAKAEEAMARAKTFEQGMKEKKYLWLRAGIGLFAGCLVATVLSLTCSNASNQEIPSALTYVAQVEVGIKGFEDDHGNSAPEMVNLDVFHQMVRPYLRESALFYDPVNFKPLLPNPILSHVDIGKLPHPESTVLIYDGTLKDGQRVVGYADGRLRVVSETQFREDLALTPHVPHSLGLYVGKWQTPFGEATIDDKGSSTLKGVGGKILNGKAAIDEGDNISLVFGPSAPAIVGKVTWLSINEVSVKTAAGSTLLISRVE